MDGTQEEKFVTEVTRYRYVDHGNICIVFPFVFGGVTVLAFFLLFGIFFPGFGAEAFLTAGVFVFEVAFFAAFAGVFVAAATVFSFAGVFLAARNGSRDNCSARELIESVQKDQQLKPLPSLERTFRLGQQAEKAPHEEMRRPPLSADITLGHQRTRAPHCQANLPPFPHSF